MGGFHAFRSSDALDALMRRYGLKPGPLSHPMRRLFGWIGLIAGMLILVAHFLL
jgi:hypothetical protein